MSVEVRSPDCPLCGHPPEFLLNWMAFCGNQDCDALSWNLTITPAQNLANVNEITFP